MNTSKANRIFFNKSSADYIPVACHYDETTLLTKNGELIQTILINGINSEDISNNLGNLRQIVRRAISTHIKDDKFGIWIHTTRRKTNLDDPTIYNNFFANNLHEIWAKKNYWQDKFVNTLYITIVYTSISFNISTIGGLLKNLNYNYIKNSHSDYLNEAIKILSNTVNQIMQILQEFGAKKLSVIAIDDSYYSELIFLYTKIIHLSEKQVQLTSANLSEIIASHSYAISNNKIQVIAEETKKFASVISFKEYQEISTEELDKVLQLPVELIATEVFYFITKSEAFEQVKQQVEILNFGNDEELKKWLSIDNFTDDEIQLYCNQQISITVINDEIENLEQNITRVSKALSTLGVMHVREDIGLEQAFWAQLPGNFKYLKRQRPALINNIASLASLHNSPTGLQSGLWGRFITLLRTEKGTPYFMNFHNKQLIGHTCIFGLSISGKTTLLNFLSSEATKFEPLITYITDDITSNVYVKALGGQCYDVKENFGLTSALLCRDDELGRRYLENIVSLIFTQLLTDKNSISEDVVIGKQQLVDFIIGLEDGNKNIKYIYENFDFSTDTTAPLKNIFTKFLQYESWYKIIDNISNEHDDSALSTIKLYNFYDLTEKNFEAVNYPVEAKLKNQYYETLQIVNQVRSIALLNIIYNFINIQSIKPRIIIIDHFIRLFKFCTPTMIQQIFTDVAAVNGILLTTVNIEDRENLSKLAIWQNFYGSLATKIILPSNNAFGKISEIFELSELEFKKLKNLKLFDRLFMIKQDNTVVAELSMGGLPGILRILSSNADDIAAVQKIIDQKGNDPQQWLEEVYELFSK